MKIMLVRSDEPPKLMKGRGIPVQGRMLVTTPMFIKAWKAMMKVHPAASSFRYE